MTNGKQAVLFMRVVMNSIAAIVLFMTSTMLYKVGFKSLSDRLFDLGSRNMIRSIDSSIRFKIINGDDVTGWVSYGQKVIEAYIYDVGMEKFEKKFSKRERDRFIEYGIIFNKES